LSVYFQINQDFPVQAKVKVGVVDSTGTENPNSIILAVTPANTTWPPAIV
jgi:hypothetical protein